MNEDRGPQALLEAFVGGDSKVFSEIVHTLHHRLVTYSYAFIPEWETCKDVVQEAFLRLHQQSRTIRDNPMGWLYRVVRNLSLDLKRKRKRHGELLAGTVIPFQQTSHDDPGRKILCSQALAKLTKRERSIVILKVVEGLSYREIAEALDLTPSNVGYILHHALKALASHINQGGQS